VRTRASILTILLLGVVVARAQDALRLSVDVQLVTWDVYVDTPAGKPITNLTRDDFVVLEDGTPREIRDFESAQNPYNILLLFDRSSSTEEQWPFLTRAIVRFLDQMPSQHQVALAAFDDKPEMLFNWRSANELKSLGFTIQTNNSGTDVYRALEWAAGELRRVKGRNDGNS
jgi:VWFA-related protein